MKTSAALLFAVFLPWLCPGQPALRLTGIASVLDQRVAVLELSAAQPPFGLKPITMILGVDESAGNVEVTAVDIAQATVRGRFHGTNFSLTLTTAENNKGFPVQLVSAPLPVVLNLYAKLTGLTLLQHPRLSVESISISSPATERAALVTVFAHALTNAGVVSIPDGDKFLRILPATEAETIGRRQIPARGTNTAWAAELLPSKAIDFVSVHLHHATRVQAELLRRALQPYESSWATPNFVLTTQQQLTRAEIIYALDVQFAWRGMRIEEVDENTARLVRLESN